MYSVQYLVGSGQCKQEHHVLYVNPPCIFTLKYCEISLIHWKRKEAGLIRCAWQTCRMLGEDYKQHRDDMIGVLIPSLMQT